MTSSKRKCISFLREEGSGWKRQQEKRKGNWIGNFDMFIFFSINGPIFVLCLNRSQSFYHWWEEDCKKGWLHISLTTPTPILTSWLCLSSCLLISLGLSVCWKERKTRSNQGNEWQKKNIIKYWYRTLHSAHSRSKETSGMFTGFQSHWFVFHKSFVTSSWEMPDNFTYQNETSGQGRSYTKATDGMKLSRM